MWRPNPWKPMSLHTAIICVLFVLRFLFVLFCSLQNLSASHEGKSVENPMGRFAVRYKEPRFLLLGSLPSCWYWAPGNRKKAAAFLPPGSHACAQLQRRLLSSVLRCGRKAWLHPSDTKKPANANAVSRFSSGSTMGWSSGSRWLSLPGWMPGKRLGPQWGTPYGQRWAKVPPVLPGLTVTWGRTEDSSHFLEEAGALRSLTAAGLTACPWR